MIVLVHQMPNPRARDVVVHVHAEAKQNANDKKKKNARLKKKISEELLSGRPDLSDKMKDQGWTLHCASFEGREDVVANTVCGS